MPFEFKLDLSATWHGRCCFCQTPEISEFPPSLFPHKATLVPSCPVVPRFFLPFFFGGGYFLGSETLKLHQAQQKSRLQVCFGRRKRVQTVPYSRGLGMGLGSRRSLTAMAFCGLSPPRKEEWSKGTWAHGHMDSGAPFLILDGGQKEDQASWRPMFETNPSEHFYGTHH